MYRIRLVLYGLGSRRSSGVRLGLARIDSVRRELTHYFPASPVGNCQTHPYRNVLRSIAIIYKNVALLESFYWIFNPFKKFGIVHFKTKKYLKTVKRQFLRRTRWALQFVLGKFRLSWMRVHFRSRASCISLQVRTRSLVSYFDLLIKNAYFFKVRVWIECHTMHLSVEPVSRIEISARDIRSRLSAAPAIPLKANFYDEGKFSSSLLKNRSGYKLCLFNRCVGNFHRTEEHFKRHHFRRWKPQLEWNPALTRWLIRKHLSVHLLDNDTNVLALLSDCRYMPLTIAVFLQSLSVTLTTCESADVQTEIACLSMDRVGFACKPIPVTSALSKVSTARNILDRTVYAIWVWFLENCQVVL